MYTTGVWVRTLFMRAWLLVKVPIILFRAIGSRGSTERSGSSVMRIACAWKRFSSNSWLHNSSTSSHQSPLTNGSARRIICGCPETASPRLVRTNSGGQIGLESGTRCILQCEPMSPGCRPDHRDCAKRAILHTCLFNKHLVQPAN